MILSLMITLGCLSTTSASRPLPWENVRKLDLAKAHCMDRWLHHQVVGDPSWDAFVREPGNPIYTGKEPYPWTVNDFLFHDPVSGGWYAYVSEYPRGYWLIGERYLRNGLLREKAGGGWEYLGVVLEGDKNSFDGDGKLPGATGDMTVIYADGRYHATYGWSDPKNEHGGLGYAWADRPEGPWRRAPKPIIDEKQEPVILDRYRRCYASVQFRRTNDWIILHAMSMPGNGGQTWALACMTAKQADGPYSLPKLLIYPQSDVFFPGLVEFFPAFEHDGFLYATGSCVARNRAFQVIFRAPIEKADKAEAWEIYQYGSTWHAEPVGSEATGIWGQSFSGQVTRDGEFRALFPCKTSEDVGVINLARRPWDAPYRDGFVLSAPSAPSFAVLRSQCGDFALKMKARSSGPWALCWDCRGPLGGDHGLADSVPHALVRTQRIEWRRTRTDWSLLILDEQGKDKPIARGSKPERPGGTEAVEVERRGGRASIRVDGDEVWSGELPIDPGRIELLAETGTILCVDRFELSGQCRAASEFWLSTEALAGAGARKSPEEEWALVSDSRFRYGFGYQSVRADALAKWNYVGRGFRLHLPRGPEYGKCQVIVDGSRIANLDLHSEIVEPSSVVLERELPAGAHAVKLRPISGVIPCDTLEVIQPAAAAM